MQLYDAKGAGSSVTVFILMMHRRFANTLIGRWKFDFPSNIFFTRNECVTHSRGVCIQTLMVTLSSYQWYIYRRFLISYVLMRSKRLTHLRCVR